MTVLERVKNLCKERGISVKNLENELNLPYNTIYQWKKRTPGVDRLEEISNYFNVSIDYLLGRTEQKHYYDLNNKDERDIQSELQTMIDNMNNHSGFAASDGSAIDDLEKEDKELLIASLEQSLRIAKRVAKQKFTPKKHRK